MPTLCDVSNWLVYFPERMDTRWPLWFARDALDVDALQEAGNAVALAVGASFEDFRRCEPFFAAFPSVFLLWETRRSGQPCRRLWRNMHPRCRYCCQLKTPSGTERRSVRFWRPEDSGPLTG